MLREWIKFRYGVFDENGFAHDEKYPTDYVGPNGKLVQTACHLNRYVIFLSSGYFLSSSSLTDMGSALLARQTYDFGRKMKGKI